jgi:hypothetical protein
LKDKSIDEGSLRGEFKTQGDIAANYFAAGDYENGIRLLK